MSSLVLYLVALASAAVMAPGATVYWDAFGYVRQAIDGDVGGLGLGRPVFVLAAHGIARTWLDAGGSPWAVEGLLRITCAAVSALAAPLTARLAARCGAGRGAAWLAGLAVACSPAMAHVSGQVLTDGPAVTLLVLACLLGVRAVNDPGRDAARPNARGSAGAPIAFGARVPWAFGAGAAIGLAAGVREQAIVNGLTFAALPLLAPRGARWRVAAAIAAGACLALLLPLIHVWLTQPGYAATVRAWVANMGRDRTVRTYRLADAGTLAVWLLSLGPIVVAAGAAAIVRGRTWWTPRPLLIAIVVPALVQMAWLATLRGIGYSPRFLLGALPLAFAIPGSVLAAAWAGESSARWRGLVAAWVLPIVVAAPVVHARSAALTGILRAWPARLQALPAGALVITGQPCPAVPLVASIVRVEARGTAGRPPDDEASRWEAVCPGWAWPDDLDGVVDRALASGRVVAADLRPAAWVGPEQQAALAVVNGVVDAHAAAARAGRLVVWRADRE